MTLGDLLRRVVGRSSQKRTVSPERQQAAAWCAAFEAGLLNVPQDVRDPRAWDIYWKNQIEFGTDQGLADMMASDDALPELLTRRGSQTILCAGNGLSTEAISLTLF